MWGSITFLYDKQTNTNKYHALLSHIKTPPRFKKVNTKLNASVKRVLFNFSFLHQ